MSEYLIKTPNPDYGGKTEGVRFEHGECVLSLRSLPRLERDTPETMEEKQQRIDSIAHKLKADWGYQVRKIRATDIVLEEGEPEFEAIAPKAKAPPSPRSKPGKKQGIQKIFPSGDKNAPPTPKTPAQKEGG